MKEVYENDDELWQKICLTSGTWNIGEEFPKVDFNFYVDKLSENNVYFSNEGIKKQIENNLQLNPNRKSVQYFYFIKIPAKELT